MLAEGRTYEEIKAEFALRWGFRPRQAWRNAYGWTQDDVAARYNQLRDDDQASVTDKHISDWENWPYGGKKPIPKTLSVLAKIYDISPSKLVDQTDRQNMNADELIALEPVPSTPPNAQAFSDQSTRSWSSSGLVNKSSVPSVRQDSPRSIRELIISSARQSLHHAEDAQGTAMPEVTLEEVTADVERLTKEHLTDSLSIFSDTVQTRDKIYRLLERRQYPSQTTHLYYLASIVCALLADTSASVGFLQASLNQTRASWAYAEIIGHNSLRFWCRTMEATLAFWRNRPQTALELTNSAADWATEPIALAGLHSAIALLSAMTARRSESRTALELAFDAHDSATGESELFERLGGMFSFSRATLLQNSTETYLGLGEIDHAENSAAEAIRIYESGPPELRAFGNEASARIDLGHARLLNGDAEGARDALVPVFELPASRRLDWIGLRLKDFHTTLRGHDAAVSSLGRQIGLEIEGFFESTASDNFPKLVSG